MKPGNTVTRLGVNISSSLITALIRITVLVWINQYLLRRIAPEEYALLPVITSLMVIAELFPLIFNQGVQRFMVAADAKGDEERLVSVVSSMVPVLASLSAVVLIGGGLAVLWIDTLVRVDPIYVNDARLMLLLLVLGLALQIGSTPFRVGLSVKMRFVEQNLILLATESLRVILLLALIFGIGPRILWVVVASSVGSALNILILIAYTSRVLPEARFRAGSISRQTMWQLTSFSLWTLIQIFNRGVLRAAPALFLNHAGSAVDVASYHVGNLADMQLRKLQAQSMSPLMPSLTNLYARDGDVPMQNLYYLGGRYFLWAMLFLLPPLMVFAHPLISLYTGGRYGDAATVMILLFAAYPFTWASAMFYHVAYAVGKVRTFNLCTLATGLAQLAGMIYFVFVRDMGAVGAALGMSGGFIVAQVLVMWPYGLKLVRGSWGHFIGQTLLPGLVPFAVSLVACGIYSHFFPIRSWTGLGLGSLASALIYLATLHGTCMRPEDRDLTQRAWRKIVTRLSGNDK